VASINTITHLRVKAFVTTATALIKSVTMKDGDEIYFDPFCLFFVISGGSAIALSLICLPFVTPALRKVCLPYVPATS